MPIALRRALLTTAAVLVVLVFVGATYQGVATALERREFPYPGRLIEIGGYQLHLYCVGDGTPTVVLEAPAAGMSAAWGWVQPAVATTTRVCSYDRAGLGWSDATARPYDPAAVAEQLHVLLERAGEHAPFVVAGQGLGAAFATLDAAQFGADAASLILVDPPPPPGEGPRGSPVVRFVNMSPWLARTGLLRATRLMSSSASGLPGPAAGALTAFLNRPDHLTRAAREMARWDDTVRLAAGVSFDHDLPTLRLEVGGHDGIAFLTDAGQAAGVSAAIVGAVEQVRRRP